MSSAEILVKLTSEVAEVILPDGTSKVITHSDLLLALDQISTAEATGEMMYLPPGAFYTSLSGSTLKVACYYPGGVVPINYLGVTKPRVIPNVVVTIVGRRARGKTFAISSDNVKFYCTKQPLEALPRQWPDGILSIYRPVPFTNIYSGCTMCFGGNAFLPEVTLPDLRPLHGYYYTLVSSPFNNDLGITALTGSGRDYTVAQWFELLAKKATETDPSKAAFPYEAVGL